MFFLTHKLSNITPGYAGGHGVELTRAKSICAGDSCNQLHISMTNHIGTHVDAPAHFIAGGKTITDYKANDWIFNKCSIIDCLCAPGDIIDANVVVNAKPDYNCELLFIKTGFEKFRGKDLYWQNSPIFHEDLGDLFAKKFSNLQAIALDTISLSSLSDREMGRAAHRSILGAGIRIFEDVAMANIEGKLSKVMAFPLLLEQADGAQVTMVAVCE